VYLPVFLAASAVGVISGIVSVVIASTGHALVALIFLYLSILTFGTMGLMYLFRVPAGVDVAGDSIAIHQRSRRRPVMYNLADVKWVWAAELQGSKGSGVIRFRGTVWPYSVRSEIAIRIREDYRTRFGNYPPSSQWA